MQIRKIKNTDFHIMINIFFDIYAKYPWSFSWLTIEKTEDYFYELINMPKSISYSFLHEGALCGGCFGFVSNCGALPTYELREIFIDSSRQNKGLGSKALHEVEIQLKKEGITSIKLSTVRSTKAFTYYIKNGYFENDEAVNMLKFL